MQRTRPSPDASKAALFAGLGAAVLAASLSLWPSPALEPEAPQGPPTAAAARSGPTADGPAVAAAPGALAPRAPSPPERVEPRHAQGLRGRTVDAAGAALADVTVELHESAGSEALRLGWTPGQRSLRTPLASTQTEHGGGFLLGLPFADDARYEVLVRSKDHATVRLTDLRLLPSVWHDLGDLVLEPGATLRGRVTIQGSQGLPVPRAVVRITAGGTFAETAAASGGRGALTSEVDADGSYEIRHAPTRGVVQVSVSAPGFARVVRRGVELAPEWDAVVDFEMATGVPLVGVVRGLDGEVVPGAEVEVWPRDAGAQPLRGRSGPDGQFRVPGLQPTARHRVRIRAPGFAPAELADVRPGDPIDCRLERRASLRVAVRTPNGGVVRSYRLALRRYFPAVEGTGPTQAAGRIGAAREVPEQRVRLDNATDQAHVVGVPGGSYLVEVRAEGWAKTFSAPFLVGTGAPAPGSSHLVEVVLTPGATLRGRVVDARGEALAGATVTTQAPGTLPDHPMLAALQQGVPSRATLRTTKTDERGWFALERLSPAAYQLQVEHPDACRETVRGIDCKAQYSMTLETISMRRGAVVRGQATVDGEAAGQIKVILTTSEAVPADQSLRVETVTDREGAYAFARRIPPGEYVLRAAAVGGAQPGSELFRQLLQLKNSSTPVTVAEGQGVVEQRLDLHAN